MKVLLASLNTSFTSLSSNHAQIRYFLHKRKRFQGLSSTTHKSTQTVRAVGGNEPPKNDENEPLPGPKADDNKEQTGESSSQDNKGLLSGIDVVPIWKKKAAESEPLPIIPKSDIEIMRNQVFGFDSFFVTGQEGYQEVFGGVYQFFLLNDPEENRPVAVVLPSQTLDPAPSSVPPLLAASLFGLTTFITLLLRSSGFVDLDFLPSVEDLSDAIPSFLVFVAVLAAHEIGHLAAAKKAGLQLGPPFFIPSLQLGSFGAITPIQGLIKTRQQLAEVATAGPLAGAVVGVSLLLIGLLLPAGEDAVIVQSTAFHDSVFVGLLGKAIFGDSLREGTSVALNPLALDAWAALLVNSINCIPVGELDGGRIANSVWGRQAAAAVSTASLFLLGLSGLFSDVALYFVVLIVFLQRGPILPQANEVSPPSSTQTALSLGLISFSLLVYAPLLIPFSFN